MPRFEVRFSVPTRREPGKATYYASCQQQNMTTVVEVFSDAQVANLVKAQYGPTTIVHGWKRL